jgi:aminopeptidase
LRSLCERDPGAARLGEVALVDSESRVGLLGRVFYDRLLDENAASHIALGNAITSVVTTDQRRARLNRSSVHADCMIGSDAVSVTGIQYDRTELPLLRHGAWQI